MKRATKIRCPFLYKRLNSPEHFVLTTLTAGLWSEAEAKSKFERLAELLADSHIVKNHRSHLSDLVRLREERVGLDKQIYHQERNIERYRLVAGQQAIAAPVVSSLSLGAGVLNTVGYHGYGNQPLVGTRLGFAGNISTISAEAIALYATPAAAIKTHLYERGLKRNNLNPNQLLTQRLEHLKTLKALVENSQP